MRNRKLTASGDYSFGGGPNDFWHDVPAAVGQAVETRLLLFLGEWYQDIGDGTPYLEGILGKHSQDTANTVIQDRIINTEGVTSLDHFVSILDADARSLSVTCTVNTIYGTTDIQVVNYANF